MNNLYKENILDHFHSPRNFGNLDNPDYFHEEENILCGDRIRMEIKLKSQNACSKIKDIMFSGEGCAISIAAASILTEKVKNRYVSEILNMKSDDVMDLIGVSLTWIRVKCALLPLEVLQKALSSGKIK